MKIVQIAVATDSDGNDSVYGLGDDGTLYYRKYEKKAFGQSYYLWASALYKAQDVTPAKYIADMVTAYKVKTIAGLLTFKSSYTKATHVNINTVNLCDDSIIVTCTLYPQGWVISCGDEELKIAFGDW